MNLPKTIKIGKLVAVLDRHYYTYWYKIYNSKGDFLGYFYNTGTLVTEDVTNTLSIEDINSLSELINKCYEYLNQSSE